MSSIYQRKKKSDPPTSSFSYSNGSQSPNAAAATMPFDKPIISATLPQFLGLDGVFKRFDADGDGKISASELGAILESLGCAATNDELGKMMREMDSNGDGFVDFNEFVLFNTQGVDSEEIITDLKNAFSVYDTDGDGLITAEEVFRVFKSLGDEYTLTECREMISGADGDGNGKIDFEEFKVMMMTPSRFEHRTQSGTYSWSRKVSLEWICVITNFVLEVPSAVLDQLSSADSAHKAGYLLSAMLLSFAALFICVLEPIYKGRKGQFIWRWRRLPWFYNASQNYKPVGSFKAFVGSACALCQCIVTAVNYARSDDKPITFPFWPIIFAFGLICSRLLKNPDERRNV